MPNVTNNICKSFCGLTKLHRDLFNMCKEHLWSNENSYAMQEDRFQLPPQVKIINNRLNRRDHILLNFFVSGILKALVIGMFLEQDNSNCFNSRF